MKKIPLETTLAGSYRFLFSKIVSIIGTIWFPYVVLFALLAGLAYLLLPPEVLHGDFSHLDKMILTGGVFAAVRSLFSLLSIIVAAMVTVNLMRHSLGLKTNTTFIYFSLGVDIWRLIGAIILAAIIVVAAVLVFVVIGLLYGFLAMPHIPHGWGVASLVVLCVVMACALIYGSVRLFFFIPAVVVAEQRISLGRSWELGGGNFWRIVLIWLCIVIPVWFIVGIVLDVTILPIVIAAAAKIPTHPQPADIAPILSAILHALPILVPVFVLANIAVRGLMAGAIGTAYNALTAVPKEEKEPA